MDLSRREFLIASAVGLAGWPTLQAAPSDPGIRCIVVRFGGGVRRQETIVGQSTYAPYFLKQLAPRGTLFTNMHITSGKDIETSHGQGTLRILTGKYRNFEKRPEGAFDERFETEVPTIFESLRKTFNVPEHQALIVNGEDRTQEEFYSFSNHHAFGVNYRSQVLSLFRFKLFRLRRQLLRTDLEDKQRAEMTKKLKEMEAVDYRNELKKENTILSGFWAAWEKRWGGDGLVNPRGDRLLTELALWGIRRLKPRMMMINYNDPDYVHWGQPHHYTRGVAIIDRGIEALVRAVDADPDWRGRTLWVVVPDCGRDNKRAIDVPFQHHFGDRSSHEIFALFAGAGVPAKTVVDRRVDQIDIAPTVAKLMNFKMAQSEGKVLSEAIK